MSRCAYCNEKLEGRSDKKYCNTYCKSGHQYQLSKSERSFYHKVDRQLKRNRKILKSFNKKGLTTVRIEELVTEGFNARFFTHYWKNTQGQTYLFCYEFGFLELKGTKSGKMLLVQFQDYMLPEYGAKFKASE